MLVEKFFKRVEYPEDLKRREDIVKNYNQKINDISSVNKKSQNLKMEILIIFFSILALGVVYILGDVSTWLKVLYIIPSLFVIIYYAHILCRGKLEKNSSKYLFEKQIAFLIFSSVYIYIAPYIFQAVSLGDEFTNTLGILSWALFVILTFGSILKARKDAPERFLNEFLNGETKYHAQPSWALNITRVLIGLVCIFKPYLLLSALSYIIISPIIYAIVYSYYTYLQYDKVQNLLK